MQANRDMKKNGLHINYKVHINKVNKSAKPRGIDYHILYFRNIYNDQRLRYE